MTKIYFTPRTPLEKFGAKIANLLVDNSQATYLVGGTVRDIILKRGIHDIDIATALKPEKVAAILKQSSIQVIDTHKQFGTIIAQQNNITAEITTLRRETYSGSRFPKVKFVNDAKVDSTRRDFTINSLYLQPKTGRVYDFYNGLRDIKSKLIRFVGNPKTKIIEDPLRIIRSLRFALTLGFTLDKSSLQALKNNLVQVQRLSKNKIASEIMKLKSSVKQKIIWNCLHDGKNLDKYF